MKKILKWTLIVVIGLAIIGAFLPDDETAKEEPKSAATTETTESTEAKAEEPKAEAKKEEPKKKAAPKNDPKITADEFAKIKNGMTLAEVEKIIGGKGEMNSETGAEGDDLYTVMYTWKGNSLGGNANFMFQGNPAVVQSKAQFGLK